jgi:hypothetical protein
VVMAKVAVTAGNVGVLAVVMVIKAVVTAENVGGGGLAVVTTGNVGVFGCLKRRVYVAKSLIAAVMQW